MCLAQERMGVAGEERAERGWGRSSGGLWRPHEDGMMLGLSHREALLEFEQESEVFPSHSHPPTAAVLECLGCGVEPVMRPQ